MINDLYKTKIECLKDTNDTQYYNVNINSTDVKLLVSLIDFNGNAVTNKSVTLSVDNGSFTSVKTGYTGTVSFDGKAVNGTTDSNGQFAVLYTASNSGLITFTCNQTSIQIIVDSMSKTDINTALNGKAASSHSHGSLAIDGRINDDISTINKIVVTGKGDNIATISKLPSSSVTHQDISGKVNVSDINNWQTINLTNGVLYVNETLRLCELHYSKSGVALTQNSWTDVETVSQIASYPHKETNNHLYASGNMPYYTIRIYRDGQIKAYSTLGSTVAVTFSAMWHY